jgi:Fe-S cluster biosynthesis and repair protein YggX
MTDDNDEAATGDVYMVECVKFGKRLEGMAKPPLKGEVGEKVYKEVSKEAWKMWLEHSKMLVNEYRLDLMSESGQQVWFSELDKYFWGDGSQLPPDFQPTNAK